MQCPRCTHENRPQAKFCEECATPLSRVCPNCSTPLSLTARFCPQCAQPVATGGAQSRFASPDSYTPKHLAEKILTSKTALEGERKQVTVLFADLKGSTDLLAELDPEEAHRLLDPVLVIMMDAVHRYEGTVNQVLGDGIMALFGAPLAHEDHAVRACYAALAMQGAMRDRSAEFVRRHGVKPQIRVGLNSGEVVVRSIANDLHMDYSAVGQMTHLAARMEQTALPGTVQLTAETARLAEGFIEVASLGPIALKGLAAPMEVLLLVGTGFATRRFQVTEARGLTRFVGREFEVDTLSAALREARAGRGRVVAVVGEPGVGKSRLYWEFLRVPREEGWLVLESSSVSYGKARPYLPVIDLLRTYFHLQDREEQEETARKITGRLGTLGESMGRHAAALLALFDLPAGDRQWELLDPPQRRQRTLQAIRDLFVAESLNQPLVLLFEDLHWIDSETQALLDSLRGTVTTARILLLVNYRPEYQLGWGSKGAFTELRIEPLETQSAEALLQSLLGQNASVAPLMPLLIARTSGNPFFLEESVRTLAETGVLEGAVGAYRLAKPLGVIQVPPTVQSMLAARIDRLPPEEKRLLQCASAIGKFVPLPLLKAVVEAPGDVLPRGLVALQASELLFESSLYPETEYSFKHALTHEVTYGSLLHEQRRTLHLRILEALEGLAGPRIDEHVEQLAHHAFRGEAWDKGLMYFRRAGERAAARPAPREAVAYFEQALAALAQLPEGRETIQTAVDIRFDLRNELFALGELDRIERYLGEAAVLAEKIGDHRRLGWVAAYRSHYFLRAGDEAQALTSARRAVELGKRSQDFALQTTTVLLGLAYYGSGDFTSANACLREIVAALDGDRARDRFRWAAYPAVTGRAYLAGSLAEVGEFAEAARHAEAGLRHAEALEHAFSLGQAHVGLGLVHLRRGDFAAAVDVFEAGLRLCETRDVDALRPTMEAGVGYGYALSGRVERGLDLLTRAVEQGAARRLGARHSQWTAWLGEATLLAGRPAEALAIAIDALEVMRRRHQRGNEAWTLRLLALVHESGPRPGWETAASCYRQAMELAETLSMFPLLARARLGLGALYRRMSRSEEARPLLEAALEGLTVMGMRAWDETARAELVALPAPGRASTA